MFLEKKTDERFPMWTTPCYSNIPFGEHLIHRTTVFNLFRTRTRSGSALADWRVCTHSPLLWTAQNAVAVRHWQLRAVLMRICHCAGSCLVYSRVRGWCRTAPIIFRPVFRVPRCGKAMKQQNWCTVATLHLIVQVSVCEGLEFLHRNQWSYHRMCMYMFPRILGYGEVSLFLMHISNP